MGKLGLKLHCYANHVCHTKKAKCIAIFNIYILDVNTQQFHREIFVFLL